MGRAHVPHGHIEPAGAALELNKRRQIDAYTNCRKVIFFRTGS
jgi:hypothetical protein